MILPMLAKPFKYRDKYIKNPCAMQPKLDGCRCIAVKTNGVVELFSRTGRPIVTMKHIAKQLTSFMQDGDIYDGELYIHGVDFNLYSGAIRAKKDYYSEIIKDIEYHIYDFPKIGRLDSSYPFLNRFRESYNIQNFNAPSIHFVETTMVDNFYSAIDVYNKFIINGYEGAMYRNLDAPYTRGKSFNLIKHKDTIDAEFECVAIESGGEGKCSDIAAKLSFLIPKGTEVIKNAIGDTVIIEQDIVFDAGLKTTYDVARYVLNNQKEFIGRMCSVQYQNLSEYNVPRFGKVKDLYGGMDK